MKELEPLNNYTLTENDTIALICAGSITTQSAQPELIKQWFSDNYTVNVIIDKHLTQWQSPQQRAEIFLNYLLDDKIKLIWSLRGGEGSADIIPFLRPYVNEIKKQPKKILIGFSDFTAILLWFSQHFAFPCIHGMGAAQLLNPAISALSRQTTLSLLFGYQKQMSLALAPLNIDAKNFSEINGCLTGGNLSLLNISIKDCWEMGTQDKIVFIEDTNEKPHSINRTLKYLQRIGQFSHCKAIIFGDFSGKAVASEESINNQLAIDKVLDYFARDSLCPVFRSNQFGHGSNNMPLVMNTMASISYRDGDYQLRI